MRRGESEDVIINQKQAGKSVDQRRRSPRYIRHRARPTFAMWYRRTRSISCPIHRTERMLSGTRPVSSPRRRKRGRKAARSQWDVGAAHQSWAQRGMARASTPPQEHKCGARRLGISLASPWRALGLIDGHGWQCADTQAPRGRVREVAAAVLRSRRGRRYWL